MEIHEFIYNTELTLEINKQSKFIIELYNFTNYIEIGIKINAR